MIQRVGGKEAMFKLFQNKMITSTFSLEDKSEENQMEKSAGSDIPNLIDTSNLSPGAAKRFQNLISTIDEFTDAVERKSMYLPEERLPLA